MGLAGHRWGGIANFWDYTFLENNREFLKSFRENLADEKSKLVFDENYKQRTTLCYARNFDDPQTQYFDLGIVEPKDDEVFADCGAFHGENLNAFLKILSEQGKNLKLAYEFEVDPSNVKKLEENVKNIPNVNVIPKGVCDKAGYLLLNGNLGKSSVLSEDGDIKIAVTTIDETTKGEKVTFIKMDIEGAELSALKGAKEQITKNKPKLAISVYHRPSDFIDIPKYIMSLRKDYKYYLRAYSRTGCETILYAV